MELTLLQSINPDGSKTEMVIKDGKDGKSPKVTITEQRKWNIIRFQF